ncbi:MAG TPA: hypothetical protein P5081_09260 [Phycisphaerae bacterium]|nr:hypothetical protein [Phycisphaerales bacterium]HPF38136.1 hypothetical protein [Phycisphaerae bacterium]HRW53065.1 hypothetical protein [Phycisphaerae bacterium]
MVSDLVTTLFSPILAMMQNFLDASFTVLNLFGFSAPNVNSIVSGLLGG